MYKIIGDLKIPILSDEEGKWKGMDVFNKKYFCALLLAQARSGKSTLIYNILDKLMTKKMVLYIFSFTFNSDKHWEWMQNNFLKKFNYKYFSTLGGKRGGPFQDLITKISNDYEQYKTDLKTYKKLKENPKLIKPKRKIVNLWDQQAYYDISIHKQQLIKPKEPPEYFIIIDDLSHELKLPIVSSMCKMFKHWKIKSLISCHYIHDMLPGNIQQVQYIFMFKGQPIEKLKILWDKLGVAQYMLYEDFEKTYFNNTSIDHSFLLIDRNNGEIRNSLTNVIIKFK
jgi:hypothetical protein